jgi:hypothetical protein
MDAATAHQRTREFFVNAKPAVIATIFPIEMKAMRPFDGVKTYILPAVKDQTEVRVLKVHAAFENVYAGNQKYVPQPVFGDEIAADLVKEWTTGLLGTENGLRPGIWILQGEEPTRAEVEQMRAMQTAYFEGLFTDAEDLFRQGKAADIHDLHRAAARWLGYESVPWLEAMRQKVLKECQFCITRIDARASVCPNCHRDLEPAAPEPVRPAARKAA